MRLPAPRGPISAAVFSALEADDATRLPSPAELPVAADPLFDDDLQLALWTSYELHYRGVDGVAGHWEWQPELIGVRRVLEEQLLAVLESEVKVPADDRPIADRLWTLVDEDDGPPMSRFLQVDAGYDQWREFVIHRSLYQLKEADPHSWVIPRLSGRAKAALVEIQVDEYGDGNADRMHAEMYKGVLRGFDLDVSYGAYLDAVPGITLALTNVMSLFGLRRELRGALVGHLAAYEMTSSEPCRRYAKGLRRLGMGDDVCAFFDVHVTADALHEQVAAHDLCGSLAADEPELTEQIIWGAAACLYIDTRFAEHVMGRWAAGQPSLRVVEPAVTTR